jgi:hypothetical protein
MFSQPRPSIGRIVIYRSRTGRYSLPAIITATSDTINQAGVDAGHIPPITLSGNVHLHVFTPGSQQGYQEHDVPQAAIADTAPGEDSEQPPGSWAWPVIR